MSVPWCWIKFMTNFNIDEVVSLHWPLAWLYPLPTNLVFVLTPPPKKKKRRRKNKKKKRKLARNCFQNIYIVPYVSYLGGMLKLFVSYDQAITAWITSTRGVYRCHIRQPFGYCVFLRAKDSPLINKSVTTTDYAASTDSSEYTANSGRSSHTKKSWERNWVTCSD
jgi:hypothetical protein